MSKAWREEVEVDVHPGKSAPLVENLPIKAMRRVQCNIPNICVCSPVVGLFVAGKGEGN